MLNEIHPQSERIYGGTRVAETAQAVRFVSVRTKWSKSKEIERRIREQVVDAQWLANRETRRQIPTLQRKYQQLSWIGCAATRRVKLTGRTKASSDDVAMLEDYFRESLRRAAFPESTNLLRLWWRNWRLKKAWFVYVASQILSTIDACRPSDWRRHLSRIKDKLTRACANVEVVIWSCYSCGGVFKTGCWYESQLTAFLSYRFSNKRLRVTCSCHDHCLELVPGFCCITGELSYCMYSMNENISINVESVYLWLIIDNSWEGQARFWCWGGMAVFQTLTEYVYKLVWSSESSYQSNKDVLQYWK